MDVGCPASPLEERTMIDQLLTLSWRIYPVAALVLFGAGLVATGIQAGAGYRGCRRSRPEWALAYLYVFRRVVVGLALVGAGVGWYWQAPGVVGAGLCIAVGEL